MRRLLIATMTATLFMSGVAHAEEPTLITITDDQIGTEAFDRLLSYTIGGHSTMAGVISEASNVLGIGVGFGVGSGGYGYRPNITLAIWGSGVDADIARSAVYQAVGASTNPITTNGDCAIACDGSYVAPRTTVAPVVATTTANPCHATGTACGWAVLDDNNNVTNVIVCDYSVCGSGTFANMRVVLQTQPTSDGNVAGYNGGSYNPETNVFTIREGTTLVGGSEIDDVIIVTTTTTTPNDTGDLLVSPTTIEMSVSQAGSRQSRTVSAPKRQSVKKCVKPLRGMARKCLTSRSPLPTLVLPTKGRTWTPTSRQEGKQ